MMAQQPLYPERRRQSTGSVALLAHRFLRAGVWSRLSQPACGL